jgi:iron complex outermembrane recepter protein
LQLKRIGANAHRLVPGILLFADLLGTTALAGEAAAPQPVAQASASASQAAASPEQGQLEEVSITAQRRTERLKDVPISVQTVSGDELAAKAISDTRDLSTIAPTINFSQGYAAIGTAFSLRGVSSLALQTGIQPSTALVVDGVAAARQAEFISNLSDIERIEILNGPQGTLFGKNSTAGVINIVTKAPARQSEGSVQGLATTDSEYGIKGMLNVPLSDRIRLRLNAFFDDQRPLIKNLGPAGDVEGAQSYGGNLKVAFDLTDNADLLLAGTYAHNVSSGGQFVPVGPSVFGYAMQKSFIGDATICRCTPVLNTNERALDIYESRNVSATFHWNITDALQLTSITSYSKFNENSGIDEGLTPYQVIVGQASPTPGQDRILFQGVDPGFANRNPDDFHYVSQELRLNYAAGRFNSVAGAYYQDYHEHYYLNLPNILDGTLVGGAPGVPYFNNRIPDSRETDRAASVFADTTYAIVPTLKAFTGLRYTNERVHVDYHRDDYFGPASLFDQITGTFAPPYNTLVTTSTHTFGSVSGRGGLQFEPDPRVNLYASYAHGYKAPAANLGQFLLEGSDPILQPETANAVEVGTKLRMLDGRAALNVAVFEEWIHGIQLTVVQPTGATFTNVLINAGTLRTRGIEADGQWAVTPHLRLGAALAYDQTAYSGFNFTCNSTQLAGGTCPNYPIPGFQSLNGQQAIEAPKIKYSLSGNYSDMLPGTDLGYYLQLDWTWNSAVYYELGQDPISREPAHGMLNAGLGLRGRDDRWELQFFGKNLTNRLFYNYMNDIGILGQPIGYLTRDFKRYGGMRLTYRF